MHLLPAVMMMMMMMGALAGMVAAQPLCDSLTQYLHNDKCCQKCKPGTSMSTQGSCEDPVCKDCEQYEYQDEHTTDPKCKLQPICDKHKNLMVKGTEDKIRRTTCICMSGFHCSSVACLTCVPHTACAPGWEATRAASHMNDTVCQKCPKGSFSNVTSLSSTCQKWKECADGYERSGTTESDSVCKEKSRMHIVGYCVFAVLLMMCIVAALAFYCRGDARRKVKGCVESCHGERQALARETHELIVTPVDDPEKDLTFPEQPSSHEEGSTRTPEENEDDPSEDMSAGVVFTENGNYVTQENGKTEILSRQESQTQTFMS